jgi:hypothetical protein
MVAALMVSSPRGSNHCNHKEVLSMASKQALLKLIPIVVAVCIGGFGGSAIAAGDTTKSDQPKVDCKKYPEHRDCKAKGS